MSSLHDQLQLFVPLQTDKDKKQLFLYDQRLRQQVFEALEIRLLLVGWNFNSILGNSQLTMEFSQLLVQLVCNGVVDFHNNSELLYPLIDMLACMIHSTLVPERDAVDTQARIEENRKGYLTVVKRLRKVCWILND